MPKYSQANRPMGVSTPLGPDVLLLQRFSGSEFLSGLFRFQLEMLAESSTDIAFDQVLGQSLSITLQMPNGSSRYFNGIVNRFSQGEQIPSAIGNDFFTRYEAEIVPQLWLLTRKAQCRIFQQITVPDILKQVLTGLNVAFRLQGTYKPRDYCIQYRETDFNFASRLMEEEGIYYFFTHAEGSHQMVVADSPMSHPDVPARRPSSTRQSKEGCGRKTGSRPGPRARRSARASIRSGTHASNSPARPSRPSSRLSTPCRRVP